MIVINFKGEQKNQAEEISSMYLVKMKEIAEIFLGNAFAFSLDKQGWGWDECANLGSR